jgi:hypothetical protein
LQEAIQEIGDHNWTDYLAEYPECLVTLATIEEIEWSKYLEKLSNPKKFRSPKDPKNPKLNEAINSLDREKWIISVAKELTTLERKKTVTVVDHIPPGENFIPTRWV